MSGLEILYKSGYTEEQIEKYKKSRKIVIKNELLYIKDFKLLINIINKCPDYVLRYTYDHIVSSYLYELFRLIRLGKNELAHRLAERIYQEKEIPEVKLIIDNLKYDKDDIKYIIHEDEKYNELIMNTYKEKEKDLLIEFYMNNMGKAQEKIVELFFLYLDEYKVYFKVYQEYVDKIDKLKIHHTQINKRYRNILQGDYYSCLIHLLEKDDYYRAHSLFKEYYLDEEEYEFSTIGEITRLLDIKLMDYLERNNSYVQKQIEINSNGIYGADDIVGKYDLSSISQEQLEGFDIKSSELKEDVNYYSLFVKKRKEKQFKEAKEALAKYKYIKDKKGELFGLDHLFTEISIMEENENNCSKEDLEIRDKLVEEGNALIDQLKYKEAIEKYKESFRYEKHNSPSTLSSIAECYLRLGEYKEAYIAYKLQESDFLYPDDNKHMVECLYRMNIGEKMEYYINQYELSKTSLEESDHQTLAYLNYILSIMHVRNGMYSKALDDISICEIESQEGLDLGLNYCYERNIISKLMHGKEVMPYFLEDYYKHTFSEKMLECIRDLDIENKPKGEVVEDIKEFQYGNNINDMIEYLLTMYKVLKEMDRRDEARELSKYLDQELDSPELSDNQRNNFTQVLKNYRQL